MTRTLRRALDILEAFSEKQHRMTLAEISEKVGLARTTCLRLLQSLEEAGYIVRVSDQDQRYCLSLKLLGLSQFVDRTLDIRIIARHWLLDLVSKTGETVALSMRDGTERICIDVALPNAQLMRVVKMGERVRLPIGATGRVLTAFAEDGFMERILEESQDIGKERLKFHKRIEEVREKGFDIAYGERIEGTTAIAAPIFDATGYGNYCLCVLGPSFRLDPQIDDVIGELTVAAKSISLQNGYVPQAG